MAKAKPVKPVAEDKAAEEHIDYGSGEDKVTAFKRPNKKFAKRTTGPQNVDLVTLNQEALKASDGQKAAAARLEGAAKAAVEAEQAKIDEENQAE